MYANEFVAGNGNADADADAGVNAVVGRGHVRMHI